ncbi:TlpA disulfide reductase family protein [Pedobacter sp. B4-66]|uniref:TlpA family protein disulfide reductase n=1 Tax=Pedobacter sp. B4-66 TaxID=2817280 RepID=UPI001BD9C0D2|nr:TlpA disulfide reductase family protein [Pedobacter sp. B4-66]
MKLKFQLLILLCAISFNINAQEFISTGFKIGLNIGDPTPPLKVKDWIKGTPIQSFEKDKIYVVEFWASWCAPCMASMSRLSELARKYQDKITVLSIDIYEKENTPITEIKKLVNSMGNRMDFTVGIEENRFMAKNWVDTSETRAIPSTFIINNGKIDWIGHPKDLDSVLIKILNKTWRPEFALIKRNNQLFLQYLESTSSEELLHRITRYRVNLAGNTYDRKMISPDSILLVVDEMVKNVPSLKYLSLIIAFKFPALLETDPQKAYNYALEAMATATDGDAPLYGTLITQIEENSEKLQIPENIYRLGAECYQALIDSNPYPEYGDMPGKYKKMANLYRLAGDLPKAAEAEQKGEKHQLLYNAPDN